jgi:hypothetical protein
MSPISSHRPSVTTTPKTNSPRLTEHVLLGLGGDPAFIVDLLGDLSEEYTYRADHYGAYAARLWYVREVVRSIPHLVWNAIRHGTPSARARLAASSLAVVVTFQFSHLRGSRATGPRRPSLSAQEWVRMGSS